MPSHPAGKYPDSWSAGGSMGGCEVGRAGSRLSVYLLFLFSFLLCLLFLSNDVILLSDTVIMIRSSVSLSWLLFLLRTLWYVSGRLGRNYDRWRNGCTITVYFTGFSDLL